MFKRVWILAFAAVLAGMVVSGCSDSDTTPPPQSTSRFRVVHGSPDAGPIDVYIGNSATPWLENLEYGQASTYLTHNTGTVTLTIFAAGTDPRLLPPYLTESFDLVAGASLTNLMAGLIKSGADEDKVRLLTYSDNFQNSFSSRVRVIHALVDAPNLRVSIGGTDQVLAESLSRWAETGREGEFYLSDVIQDIVVQGADKQITSFRAPALEVKKDYYFFLIGSIWDLSFPGQGFELLIVGPGGALTLEQNTPRYVRLVHTSPDGGQVDFWVAHGLGRWFGNHHVTSGLDYGDASTYHPVDDRQVLIELYEAGADPDLVQPKFSQSVYIHDEAPSTTVFAAGLAASQDPEEMFRMFELADTFGVHRVGDLDARVVHACSNLDTLKVDFDDDSGIKATAGRFDGNIEGRFSLPGDMKLNMTVLDGASLVDVFTTPAMSPSSDFYLILTGIKDGSTGFSLLSVNEDGSQGFTSPN